MKNKKNQNIIFALLGVVVVCIIGMLIISNIDTKKDESKPKLPKSTIPSAVENLYKNLTDVNCDGIVLFDIKDKVLDAKKFSDNDKINLILRRMEINNKLTDNPKFEDYKNAALEVFGKSVDFPTEYTDFKYKDNSYSLNGSNFSSIEATCEPKHDYVNHLYGYFVEPSKIIIDLNIGYKENDKVYDLDGTELASYDKDELQMILSLSTGYRLTYTNDGSGYTLSKVENVVKVRN